MATLNYAFKEISCKIVFYGCGLCGKTTNLQYIHTTVPGKFRGELVSLATEQDRTLFFDFLPLDLGEVKGFKTKFQLYTVPGQVYYNATRKLVLRGVDGIVFVVDSQRDRFQENLDSLENLKQNLSDYGYSLEEIPWVLQYNKRDMPDVLPLAELEKAINTVGVPYIESVATTGQGVRETLKAISSLVIRNLSHTGVGPGATAKPTAAAPGPPPGLAAAAPGPPPSKPQPAASAPAPTAASPAGTPPAAVPASPKPSPAERGPAPSVPAASPAPAPVSGAPSKIRVETVQTSDAEALEQARKREPGPKLDVRQKCDVRWRGMRIGKANLTLANRDADDDRGEYQISGVVTRFGILKQSWARLLRFKVTETKTYLGASAKFLRLESAPGDEGPILTVWVKDGYDQQVFLYFAGFGGPITILPEGAENTP